ncbi:MAG: right-handed parallel beta-helix repeat-containing protein, partial [Gammaproteobacteria bacterium]|nr:right-handed parallel beta-helix repeat-containing protein [Gammaproteobacteria bacterium]
IDSGSGTYNHRRGDIVEVASVPLGNNEWSVPRNIVFRNAKIEGSLRVYGLGKNGEAARVKASSYNESHVEYVRKNAPSDITLESLDIKGYGRTPVYFSPGVTEVTLRQSRIHGESIRVGIYLDAESGRNSITNNIISVTTQDGSMFGFYDRGWPQIAIDGSQSNVIEGNQFYRLQQGGIYVYRNCGEGGTVRHSKPSNNRLVDNEFHYTLSSSNPAVANPAIYIGSRDYGLWEKRLPGSHCNDDEQPGVKIGSAVSNADHATDTEIRGNRVHLHQTVGMYRMPRGYSLRERFIVRNPKINRGTVTADNALVVDRTRLSENYK